MSHNASYDSSSQVVFTLKDTNTTYTGSETSETVFNVSKGSFGDACNETVVTTVGATKYYGCLTECSCAAGWSASKPASGDYVTAKLPAGKGFASGANAEYKPGTGYSNTCYKKIDTTCPDGYFTEDDYRTKYGYPATGAGQYHYGKVHSSKSGCYTPVCKGQNIDDSSDYFLVTTDSATGCKFVATCNSASGASTSEPSSPAVTKTMNYKLWNGSSYADKTLTCYKQICPTGSYLDSEKDSFFSYTTTQSQVDSSKNCNTLKGCASGYVGPSSSSANIYSCRTIDSITCCAKQGSGGSTSPSIGATGACVCLTGNGASSLANGSSCPYNRKAQLAIDSHSGGTVTTSSADCAVEKESSTYYYVYRTKGSSGSCTVTRSLGGVVDQVTITFTSSYDTQCVSY